MAPRHIREAALDPLGPATLPAAECQQVASVRAMWCRNIRAYMMPDHKIMRYSRIVSSHYVLGKLITQ